MGMLVNTGFIFLPVMVSNSSDDSPGVKGNTTSPDPPVPKPLPFSELLTKTKASETGKPDSSSTTITIWSSS